MPVEPKYVLKYLARLFVDNQRSGAELMGDVSALAQAADLKDWQPRLLTQAQLPDLVPYHSMALANEKGWSVTLSPVGWQFEASPVFVIGEAAAVQVPEFPEFMARAAELVKHVVPLLKAQPHRLASVQTYFLQPSSDVLAEVGSRMLTGPAGFDRPFEWDWRMAWKSENAFGGIREPLNTVAIVKRTQLDIKPVGIREDGLLVSTDFNTEPNRSEARFGVSDIADFFRMSVGWHAELNRKVLTHAGVN